MTFLFVACFLVAETIVSRYVVQSPVIRFVLRVALLSLYTLLIKYMFDYFDGSGDAGEEDAGMAEPIAGSEVKEQMTEQNIHLKENGTEQ